MSLEDLKEHGVLLPEEERGTHSLETTVSQGWILAAFAVAVLSLGAIYFGGGALWTWVGLGGFLVALYGIVWICDRAVVRQRERVRRERKERDGGE